MDIFTYRTRGMVSPQGKPRVYLCCHPKDTGYIDEICRELLSACDCAIWVADPQAVREEAFLEDLKQMQLFVLIVTESFLTKGHYALEREFAFAKAHHIPVLPLMQEPGLAALFNKTCGELQFLDKHIHDLTSISYSEKLRKFLDETLLDDETRKKVRSAFDGRYFLSYRKKDRKQALELMHLIHENQPLRDVAVWYDEFLTPGENYNDTIHDAIHDSDLFVLAVTPSLMEPSVSNDGASQENYVVRCEYPAAKELEKAVLPLEMASVNRNTLEQKFPGIPSCTDPRNPTALCAAMTQSLPSVALGRKQGSAEHDYLIGLAYLHGIDMEVDIEKAVPLIRKAAEAELPEAVETMVKLYGWGKGVERSLKQMHHWQSRLIDLRLKQFELKPTKELGLTLLEEIQAQSQLYDHEGNDQKFMEWIHLLMDTAAKLMLHSPCAEGLRYLSAGYLSTANRLFHMGGYEMALGYYLESETYLSSALQMKEIAFTDNALPSSVPNDPFVMILLQDYCAALCGIGDATMFLAEQSGNAAKKAEAHRYFLRAYNYLDSPVMKDNYPAYKSQLSVIYDRMGTIESDNGNLDEAKKWYEKALELDAQRALEIKLHGDLGVFDSCARSLYALATVDPREPDTFLLQSAKHIWEDLAQLVPEFPEYRERVSDLEVYLKDCYNYYERKFYAEKAERNDWNSLHDVYPKSSSDLLRLRFLPEHAGWAKPSTKAVHALHALVAEHKKREAEAVCNLMELQPKPEQPAAPKEAARTKQPDPEKDIKETASSPAAKLTKEELKKQQELEVFHTTYAKASRGDGKACLKLARYYMDGKGTMQNYDQAEEWAKKAILHGWERNAKIFLLHFYCHTKIDYLQAKKYAKLCAKQYYPHGFYSLYLMRKRGQGVRKNLLIALYWLMRYLLACL